MNTRVSRTECFWFTIPNIEAYPCIRRDEHCSSAWQKRFLSISRFRYKKRPSFSVRQTRVPKRRTLQYVSSASRLGEILGKGFGRSIPRRRRLSLSENGNPFVRFADISPIRGISHCHFVTSPQRGAPLPYNYIEMLPDNNHYSFLSLQSSVFNNICPSPIIGNIR